MPFAVVTGAHGFVGRHVARQLAGAGYSVMGIGHGDWIASEAAAWGMDGWKSADIDLASLVEHCGTPDAIVHCAGSGSVPLSLERPREDFRRNVEATLVVLEFARLYAPAAHIVVPSSAAVYGAARQIPITVAAPLQPVSPYGVHKAIAEKLVASYAAHFGVNAAIVRLFSVYGAGLRKQLLWDTCTKLSVATNTFSGTGDETRDWLHVEDAAALLVAALAAASPTAPIVNGASGEGTTVRWIVERIATRLGPTVPMFSGQGRPGDPQHYIAEISESRALGWVPRHDLASGIDAYVDWFTEEYG